MAEMPRFLTVEQAAKLLQLGRSKTYELTVEWDRTDGRSGIPFVWLGNQKRIPSTRSCGGWTRSSTHPRRDVGPAGR